MSENPDPGSETPKIPKTDRSGMRTALLAAAKMKEIEEKARRLAERTAPQPQPAPLAEKTEGGEEAPEQPPQPTPSLP